MPGADGWDDFVWRRADEEPDERHTALTRGVRSTAGIPDDARAMGLDRNTTEGAMVGMAGSLSSSRLSHRILAWVLLVLLVTPLVWNFLVQLGRLL